MFIFQKVLFQVFWSLFIQGQECEQQKVSYKEDFPQKGKKKEKKSVIERKFWGEGGGKYATPLREIHTSKQMMCKSAGHHFYHTALHQRTCKKDCSIRKDHTLLWLDFFPLLPSLMLLFLPRLVSGLSFKLISTSPLELQPKIHLFHKGWMIFRMILLLCRRFFSY